MRYEEFLEAKHFTPKVAGIENVPALNPLMISVSARRDIVGSQAGPCGGVSRDGHGEVIHRARVGQNCL